MAKSRSPQFPVVGLKEAIDKARLVWEKDYQVELPREVIAEHMGYSGLNGKSLGLIAAVSRFGLLDGRGDKTHITDLAVQILAHESGDPQRKAAILTAAKSPKLFMEIDAKFLGHSPSDQALRSYLLTRGFTHSGAEGVIRSFRDTEKFVKEEALGYDEDVESEEQEPDLQPTINAPIATTVPQPLPSPNSGVPTISMSDNGLEISGGVISTIEQFEKLMRRLSAGKTLLEDDDGLI